MGGEGAEGVLSPAPTDTTCVINCAVHSLRGGVFTNHFSRRTDTQNVIGNRFPLL